MIEHQLRHARWFGGKSRAIASTHVVDRACWLPKAPVCLVQVDYAAGPPETYVLADGIAEPRVARALLDGFRGASVPTERGGSLVFRPTHLLDALMAGAIEPIAALRGEQSNTSIRFGDALILKLFRRVQFGANPDVEIGWFLTEHTPFRGTPAVAGTLEYTSPAGETASLALLQRFEPNRGDAWTTTLERLRAVLAGDGTVRAESVAACARLGQTTAELHLALASGRDAAFQPEPISGADVAAWRAAILDEVQRAVAALRSHDVAVDADALSARAAGIDRLAGALKIRHHGDYHLGQVLERADGSFVIIDFEGEPARPLAVRREKRSPLRDVAGMLRSFDYARHAALRAGDPSDHRRADLAATWYTDARAAFLETYLDRARAHPRLIPTEVQAPLAALELEKAAYEVLYELNNRPDWLPIPLAALGHA